MAEDTRDHKPDLEDKVEEVLHLTPGKESRYAELALDTLAALLKSEDEKVRLQAAQILLTRLQAPAAKAPMTQALEKLSKRRK